MGKVYFGLILFLSISASALSPSVPAQNPFFESVVYISTEVYENGESLPSACNATLISNRYAITAAHCVADSLLQGIKVTHVQVGQYYSLTDKRTGRVHYNYKATQDMPDRPVRFFITEALRQKLRRGLSKTILPDEDVAILEFEDPIAIQSQRFPPLTKAIPPTSKIKAVSINHDENVGNTQAKREADLNRVYSVPGAGVISLSTSRFAPADSGAPVFVEEKGEFRLFAVVKGRRRIFGWDVISPVGTVACTIARESALNDQGVFCH